jgi:phage tail-like protein
MKPVEFRRQVFRSPTQWEYGVSYRLQRLHGGGLALFSSPAFAGWATQAGAARGVTSLAVDPCGRVFWMHRHNCHLYRLDPTNGLIEPMVLLADCAGGRGHAFGRLLSVEGRLWLLDLDGSRLLGLRPDTFQIIAEMTLEAPVDAAFGGGRLVSLDRDGIRTYDVHGRPTGGARTDRLSQPAALGVDPAGRWIYVVDAGARGFLRFAADGTFDSELGRYDDAAPGFRPYLLVVHPDGNLFVSDGSAVAHEFAADGGYIGSTGDVSPVSALYGMTVDSHGELYVGAPEGIARFSRTSGVAGNNGQFYTRTLDNGSERGEGWHRLDLSVDLDAGGALDVYYASADDSGLASAVNGIFDRPATSAARVASLEAVLGDRWQGPHELRALAGSGSGSTATLSRQMSHSVLFRSDTKRYLWLKLELSGLAPRARAAVRELRVFYPRLSYLRYLPAVYQQDPVSQEFLERFLSMFETVFSGLEATIERIPEIFDPELTPHEFLDWLAQWLDLGIEEEWSPSVKRRLITNASRLYQLKGTPTGLAEFIEVVTNSRPLIRESFEAERPLILSDGSYLGTETRLFRRPVEQVRRDERTVLGCSSILGTSRVRSSTHVPVNPFRAAAHRFTVLLDLSPRQFQRYERGLNRIIRENAPAHVGYEIRLVRGAGLGPNAILGMNTRVDAPQPFHLGYSNLGWAVCTRRVRYGPELGIDTSLAESQYESRAASACSDGER